MAANVLSEAGMFTGAGNLLIGGTTDITGSGGLKVFGTTASTSTTTGALQVAGGVGVAGAFYVGGATVGASTFDYSVNNNSAQAYTIQNNSTGASGATRLTIVAGASSGSIQLFGSGHTTPNILQYASPSSHKFLCNGVARLDLDVSGNLTTGGSISTSAPTGGAGAWELGVANTVTPTAPNRTITIEIGGTVFYLHAKTTND
jgi:hypothetical protein